MPKTPDAATARQAQVRSQPAPAAPDDAGLRTHLMNHQRRKHVPEAWGFGQDGAPPPAAWLTVQLGGESIRALVRHVEQEDLVVAELVNLPFSRNHSFRQHDFVACARKRDQFSETWEAARDKIDRAELERLAAERQRRIAAAEQAKRGETRPRRETRKAQ
jgi:hypothetical protein